MLVDEIYLLNVKSEAGSLCDEFECFSKAAWGSNSLSDAETIE